MPEPKPINLYELLEPATPRLLHAGDEWDGQPFLYMDDAGVQIVAGEDDRGDKGIHITSEFGTQITGPMSFAEMPQHMRPDRHRFRQRMSFNVMSWIKNLLVAANSDKKNKVCRDIRMMRKCH